MPAPTPKGLVFTGARARLTIANQAVGYAEGCSGGEELTYFPVHELDNIQVAEHVPVAYDVSFSAARVRLIGKSVRGPDLAIFPKLGNNPDEHLRNILAMGELVIQIEDSQGGGIFMILEQAKMSGHNWSIQARSIVSENVGFVGIRMRDEAES